MTAQIMGGGNFETSIVKEGGRQFLSRILNRSSLGSDGVRLSAGPPQFNSEFYTKDDSESTVTHELLTKHGNVVTVANDESYQTCGEDLYYTRPITTITNKSEAPLVIRLQPIVELDSNLYGLVTTCQIYVRQVLTSLF